MTDAQNDQLSPYQLAVLDELLERQAELSTTSVPGAPKVHPSHDRGLGSALLSPRGRRIVVRSATAALAAAAVILAVVLVVPGRSALTPKWELAGEVSPYWHEAAGSLDYDSGSSLTCPSVTTCYVTGLPDGIDVTHDGGKTWNQLFIYNRLLPRLACVSASTCALVEATATSPARFFFSWTTDGGRDWTSVPAPNALSIAQRAWNCAPGGDPCGDFATGPMSLSCTTASSCVVVASSPPVLPENSGLSNLPAGAVELVTDDRGRSWKRVSLPSGFLAADVQCFSWGRCIAASDIPAPARALYSTDGGMKWASASVPAVPGFVGSLSCSDASDCIALLVSPGMAKNPTPAFLLVSKDGGRSWSKLSGLELPPGKAVTGLSCPTSSDCRASADTRSTMYEETPGSGPSGGLVASTTNGGDSWQVDQLPSTVQGVGAVSCPSFKACFALGWTGSSSVLLTYKS